MTDSVSLIVRLNDSVFSQETWKRIVADPAPASDSQLRELPTATILLINGSDRPLQIPLHHISIGLRGITLDYTEVEMEVGRGMETFDRNILADQLRLRSEDHAYFGIVVPHDTTVLIPELSTLTQYSTLEPAPGRYWLAVWFQNYRWVDSLPPIWIGRVAADTVWFTVE